jgi:hypothetical protein
MALAHLFHLLKKLIRAAADAYTEAHELRRTMARRYPHIEEE